MSCKKESIEPVNECQPDKQFVGKYVGTNTWQHDTIEIVFNKVLHCKQILTIKGFSKPYNLTVSNCNTLTNKDYDIVDNIITATNSKIVVNIWSNDGIHNDNDISIYGCNNNQLNFKKIN